MGCAAPMENGKQSSCCRSTAKRSGASWAGRRQRCHQHDARSVHGFAETVRRHRTKAQGHERYARCGGQGQAGCRTGSGQGQERSVRHATVGRTIAGTDQIVGCCARGRQTVTTKLTLIIAIAILGGLLMFGILHYSRGEAKQQAQVQCLKGDQKADQGAAEKQHQADMQTLAEAQDMMRKAQIERDKAQAIADSATARANRLQASMDTLRRTDPAVRSWYAEPLPVNLRSQLKQ